MTEQEAEAERAWKSYMADHGYATKGSEPDTGADFSAGFERGAAWERSRLSPRVAAPSDTDRALIVKRLRQRWTPDNLLNDLLRDAADALERPSQPVQVEVTDDRRERVAEAIYLVYVDEGGVDGLDSFTYPWATRTPRVRERFYRQADAALAALGGGDHE